MEILMDNFWIALPPKQGTVDGADPKKNTKGMIKASWKNGDF